MLPLFTQVSPCLRVLGYAWKADFVAIYAGLPFACLGLVLECWSWARLGRQILSLFTRAPLLCFSWARPGKQILQLFTQVSPCLLVLGEACLSEARLGRQILSPFALCWKARRADLVARSPSSASS